MGWAERLNPKSDWNLRNARRIIAQHEEEEQRKRSEEAIKKLTGFEVGFEVSDDLEGKQDG